MEQIAFAVPATDEDSDTIVGVSAVQPVWLRFINVTKDGKLPALLCACFPMITAWVWLCYINTNPTRADDGKYTRSKAATLYSRVDNLRVLNIT